MSSVKRKGKYLSFRIDNTRVEAKLEHVFNWIFIVQLIIVRQVLINHVFKRHIGKWKQFRVSAKKLTCYKSKKRKKSIVKPVWLIIFLLVGSPYVQKIRKETFDRITKTINCDKFLSPLFDITFCQSFFGIGTFYCLD